MLAHLPADLGEDLKDALVLFDSTGETPRVGSDTSCCLLQCLTRLTCKRHQEFISAPRCIVVPLQLCFHFIRRRKPRLWCILSGRIPACGDEEENRAVLVPLIDHLHDIGQPRVIGLPHGIRGDQEKVAVKLVTMTRVEEEAASGILHLTNPLLQGTPQLTAGRIRKKARVRSQALLHCLLELFRICHARSDLLPEMFASVKVDPNRQCATHA
mmetsp:Transcript_159968/g.489341  ORF Transcript_159968/g.489341 Transcript_159968/m.489341 type:complete len:213 (-) Transcript_159968:113-751(-)